MATVFNIQQQVVVAVRLVVMAGEKSRRAVHTVAVEFAGKKVVRARGAAESSFVFGVPPHGRPSLSDLLLRWQLLLQSTISTSLHERWHSSEGFPLMGELS